MEVYCNKCNKDFEIKAKEKKYADGIVELYFKCPYCKERYTSFFTDKNIRQKQKKVRKFYEQYGKETDEHKIIELLKQIDDLKVEIGNDMNKLKNRMLGTQ
ncbi:transglycosylase [Clostridium sporogenes]|uniref:transglycosylase n=1 Tax=Clostridium sporogenes TaxID=1509 RepID=UPI001F27268C|nr:transglycosylase [Clostridium sporogenes]EKS4344835.1 transglycosylase [Clostridium botulinum]EKS4395308.1 transglycosylase [Clostridium botulinum]UJA30874.1 transglycosylase [Clostridium sporogenes]